MGHRRTGLLNGDVDTAEPGPVHTAKSIEVTTDVDDGNIRCRLDFPRSFERPVTTAWAASKEMSDIRSCRFGL